MDTERKAILKLIAGAIAWLIAVVVICSVPAPARAESACDEWATMTQVLVIRWQNDPSFSDKDASDVKKELQRTMGGHPEIKTALRYVDFAWQHREDDLRQVWKTAYNECAGTRI